MEESKKLQIKTICKKWITVIKFHDTEEFDIHKIVVSNRSCFGKQFFKYFIGYKCNKESWILCIFFPEISIYKIYFDKTKCIYFMIKDEKKLDKYMTIWKCVSNAIKKLIVNFYIIKNI